MCLFTLRLPLKRRGSLLWLHTYINNSTCSEWSSLPQRCVSACINHSQASAVEQMVTLLKDRNSYICRIWRTGVNVGVFHRRRSTCYPHFDMFSFYEKLLLCFEREKKNIWVETKLFKGTAVWSRFSSSKSYSSYSHVQPAVKCFRVLSLWQHYLIGPDFKTRKCRWSRHN